MIAASVSAVVSPGTATMSRPTEQTAVIALELLERQRAGARGGDHAGVLADRDERARQAAHRRRRHHAALLHRVGEQRQRRGRARRARRLEPHRLQDLGHRIADRGRRRQRQIDDAEADTVGPRRRATSRPMSSPARVTLNAMRLMVSATSPRSILPPLSRRRRIADSTTPGPEHADVDDAFAFADAVQRAGDERVVVGDVGEHHQLGAADAAAVGGRARRAP